MLILFFMAGTVVHAKAWKTDNYPADLAVPEQNLWKDILSGNSEKEQLRSLEKKPAVKIIRNDADVQAVVNSELSLGGAVFYKAGSVGLLQKIEVDRPCVVLLRKTSEGLSISLADPTQKLSQVRVTLDGSYHDVVHLSQPTVRKDQTILLVSLPKGGEAGKSVTLTLKNFEK